MTDGKTARNGRQLGKRLRLKSMHEEKGSTEQQWRSFPVCSPEPVSATTDAAAATTPQSQASMTAVVADIRHHPAPNQSGRGDGRNARSWPRSRSSARQSTSGTSRNRVKATYHRPEIPRRESHYVSRRQQTKALPSQSASQSSRDIGNDSVLSGAAPK